jgi:phenylacetate-CoA ligase
MLNAQVMDHYGMAERVAFITQCEDRNYHVNSDYSFVQIVDDRGNPTRDLGYLVGTTFYNEAMPLIRYKLSDRTRWKEGSCGCGRTYPMVHAIEGKSEDVILGSDGYPISPSIITFAFKGLTNIEKSQVAQIADGHWEIRVVPLPGYGDFERASLKKNIEEMIDPGLRVTIVERSHIPRTAAGKYRWIINEWKSSGSPDTT